MPEPETLLDLLQRASGKAETGLRFLDRRERESWHSWAQLLARSEQLALGLAKLGLLTGQRVGLVFPTCADFFHAFFAVQLAGLVPVPLYPPVRLGRLEEYHRRTATMLRAVAAPLMLADSAIYRLLGETRQQAELSHGCLTVAELGALAGTGQVPEARQARDDDLALVQFSSGTTVEPKPVALSHRAVMAQVRLLNGFWPDSRDLRHSGVSWLPLYHDMGLIGCAFAALERPAVLTLLGPEAFVARPALWLRAISRYRATVSVAPNFAYSLCADKVRDEQMDGVDLSSWRVALNGAEPVAPGALRAFQHRFAPWGFRPEALTPVYGLSEAALAVTFSPPGKGFRSLRVERRSLAEEGKVVQQPEGFELVSVGCPLPGFEVQVRDAQGQLLGEGEVGRVWTRGPSLMEGYLDLPAATAEVLHDGWLDTGDLGFLREGHLYLTGRAKDVVILRGRNHSPAEVEQAVDSVQGVRRGCAVAVGHLAEGEPEERLWLFVERAGRSANRTAPATEDLIAACKQAVLAEVGLRVAEVHLLQAGTLPRTSSGKLRRGETLRRHLAGELLPPARVTPLLLARAWARSQRAHQRARREEQP